MKQLTGLKVLLVEDDDDARDLATTVLVTAGANVTQAASGSEGVEHMAEQRFDVIVSDIAMPEMDGITMLRLVHGRVLRSSRAPALAFTAFASKGDRASILAAGFDEHLAKTADPDTFVETVARLGGRSVAHAC